MHIGRVVSIALGLALAAACGACADPPSPSASGVTVSPANADGSLEPASDPPLAAGDWSLTPLQPDAAFVTAARTTCLAEMDAAAGLPLLVHDQRRPDLAALYFEGPNKGATLLLRRLADGTISCEGGGGGDLPFVRGVDLTIVEWTNISDDQSEGWMIVGYVDDRATAVRMKTLDGRVVQASVGHGRFVAIYRGPERLALLVALDGTGREIAREDNPFALGGGPDEPFPS